jgi:hypothetical protein
MVQLTALLRATAPSSQMSEAATTWIRRRQRPDLPHIAPGQLWLVEISPEDWDLPAFEQRVFVAANVVIYDQVLGPLVATALPLGNYAEPATASSHESDKAAVRRCLRFVLDGWSVIRLVKGDLAAPARVDRLLRITEGLLAGGVSPDLPVGLSIAVGNAAREEAETCLGGLDAVFDACSCEGRLTAVFSIGSLGALPLHAAATNGLAG